MTDPKTQASRGFAFVLMATREDAQNLIRSLDGSTLQGKPVAARLSRRGGARPPTPGKYSGVIPPSHLKRA